jgi:integrase
MFATLNTDQCRSDQSGWSADRFWDEADMSDLRIFTSDDGYTGPDRIARTSTKAMLARNRQRLRTGRVAAGTFFRPAGPRLRSTIKLAGLRGFPVSQPETSPDPSLRVADDGAGESADIGPMSDAADARSDIAAIVAEALKQIGAEGAHRINSPVRISEDSRGSFTLREWYESELKAERTRRIESGRNKSGTGEKDLSALGYWERFTANPQLCEITADQVQSFISGALRTGRRATASGYVGHLRWMLNEARRAGIIQTVPGFAFPKVSRRTVHEEFRETLIYETNGDLLGTIGRIYEAIGSPELQLAFLCGASFGPRTEDLLTLTWSAFDLESERPVVRYVAEKTGSFHVVPLVGWLVRRLQAGQTDDTYVFPTLISHKAKDPRKSRAARKTVAAMRDAAAAAGFHFDGRPVKERKPFQVLRATCNERFERHSKRAGEWILGHAMSSVNRKSYQNPGSEIYEAVNTLPQPEAFLRFSGNESKPPIRANHPSS